MITKLNLFLIINTFVLCFSFLHAQTWNTFNTAYGYIQLGPANIDWAHIYTDRPKFIFNKDIYSMNGGFSSYNSNDLLLKTQGITRLSIKSNNGFVGIGTTSPTRMLDVIGDSKINGELKINSNLNYDWGYGLSVWINRDKTKAFTINSNSTGVNLFTIWGNGIVNAKKIYAEEVEVRVDAIGVYWPDYVFKRDYELTPLNELEEVSGCLF